MGVLAAGACFNLAGLGVALFLIRGQAKAGQMARARQEAVYPVSVKLYEDAWRRNVITLGELQCFRSSAACPDR